MPSLMRRRELLPLPLLLASGTALAAALQWKITGLKTFVVDAFRCNRVFVKSTTDQGLTGLGEGSTGRKELSVEAARLDI